MPVGVTPCAAASLLERVVQLGVLLAVAQEDPVEEALLERRPGLQRHVVQPRVVQDVVVAVDRLVEATHVRHEALRDDVRVRDAQLHLVERERLLHGLLQQLDLPGGVVRDAEVVHLAGRVQLVEGLRDLFRLDQGVGAVQQQDVDVVGAEGGERLLDRGQDVLVREVEVRAVAVGRMPTLVCSTISARSAGVSATAAPNRSSQPCQPPYTAAWSNMVTPASREAAYSDRMSSSLMSLIRIRPTTTSDAVRSVCGNSSVFTRPILPAATRVSQALAVPASAGWTAPPAQGGLPRQPRADCPASAGRTGQRSRSTAAALRRPPSRRRPSRPSGSPRRGRRCRAPAARRASRGRS